MMAQRHERTAGERMREAAPARRAHLRLRLLLLAGGAGLAAFAAFGPSLFLKADGVVLRPQVVLAAPFEAQVKEIHVHPGEEVVAGQRIARIESHALMQRLGELSAREIDLKARLGRLESRLTVVDKMLPLAASVEKDINGYFDRLQSLALRGTASTANLQDTSLAHFSAAERRVELAAEQLALRQEIAETRSTLAHSKQASNTLRAAYGEGNIRAPSSGIVGPVVASVGEVLVPGKKILEIFGGAPFVLAYLPADYLFAVREGEAVVVSSADRDQVGRVGKILPVAGDVPDELRGAARSAPRSRLARIELADANEFALLQKVRVASCYVQSCERVVDVAAAAMRSSLRQLWPHFAVLRDGPLDDLAPPSDDDRTATAAPSIAATSSSVSPAREFPSSSAGLPASAIETASIAASNEVPAADASAVAAPPRGDDQRPVADSNEGAGTQTAAAAEPVSAPDLFIAPAAKSAVAEAARTIPARSEHCAERVRDAAQGVHITFLRAGSALDAASRNRLGGIAAAIADCHQTIVEVSGHTDSEGLAERNKRLSEARAKAVADHLMTLGVASRQLVTIGHGAARPIAPNDTDESRKRNRRIEIRVIGPRTASASGS